MLSPNAVTVDVLFEDIARRMPEAIALKGDAGNALSYAALDREADGFARFLHAQDVGHGDAVVLLAGRSVGAIVALLGILKTGALYVPLDVGEPPARRDRMLKDSAPQLVLTADGVGLDDIPGRRVFHLEHALTLSRQTSGPRVSRSTTPGDIACVMYTSGSTGQPKGVLVPHRAVARLVQGQSYAPFGAGETFLHLAPLAFDASTFEIWGALLNGGSVAVVAEAHPSLDTVVEAIAQHEATVAWFTAGLFSLLVDHRIEGLKPLKCILAGGDVLSARHVARAYAGLPDCGIVNGYGPTENTTFTCCYPIPREGWGTGAVPIGLPIAETGVHLLDEALQPVRPGDPGQIACAGAGLAAGYLHREDLTAETFVMIETGPGCRERVYLTGDLGRQRSDGVVEFLGRIDTQVKIRGKRVELGEIENALRSDPAVLDAVVVARDAPPDGKRLSAYLVLAGPAAIDPNRGKRALARLRGMLPDHMIPIEAAVLDALPLTTNGKVDRARLPAIAPIAARPSRDAAGSAWVENKVAALWAETLCGPGQDTHSDSHQDLDRDLDRDANFFDQGGSSLTLMALHAALRSALCPRLSLMAVFQHTSVRALARHIEALDGVMPLGASADIPVPATLEGALPR
ncbi:non-ribosomal peptide synthetase [Lichenihabitans sp. Uapishka_5]|uniref:non-ribosomal peptide synthetase n=1 Tax=Lichenihabitans sp. Uapishka_5 TaxID=3037302 RepID=UPI0029E8186B|nr:non-ribosomal peptide synthetase [Lichenihabitans sp. Uapishka_5]MDX7950261.1 non-ribosomal peptide synthetase [Lichenihabitans sp. Uapishka_5]